MKNVSQEYKNKAKGYSRVNLAKFEMPFYSKTIDEQYLYDGFIDEISYADDTLIGNAIAKNLEMNVVSSSVEELNIDYNNQEIVFYTGLLLDNGQKEYVKQGTFIIDSVEEDIAANKIKITALDYMIKFNQEFKDTLDWDDKTKHYTLLDFADMVCEQCDMTLATRNFPNSSYVLTQQPAFEGYQCRYVLSKIAEIGGCSAYINNDDQVEIKLANNNDIEEIRVNSINEYQVDDTQYKPINAVVLALADGIEGENVTKRDEESIALYGETSLIITANEFAISESVRFALINEIFDNVNGFYYVPLKITYNSYDYLDRMDKIRVYYDNENYYDTYLFNHNKTFPSSLKSTIESPIKSNTNTKYEYTEQKVQAQKHTEIVVDKLNNQISSIVQEIAVIEGAIDTFDVELDYNSVDIPVNDEYFAIRFTGEDDEISINFSAKYKGQVVQPSVVSTETSYEGITPILSKTKINFLIDKDTPLTNQIYVYDIYFGYQTGLEYGSTNKKIVLTTEQNTYTTLKNNQEIGNLNINLNALDKNVSDNYYKKVEIDKDFSDVNDILISINKDVETLQDNSQLLINFKTNVEENGVTKLNTNTGYKFDENGLEITKTDAPTSSRLNQQGLTINDKNGNEVEYVGYDEQSGRGIVRTGDLRVTGFLIAADDTMRIEKYKEDGYKEGYGFFTMR